jgi:hypothetical protein
MRKVTYFTKDLLIKAAKIAERRGYNRQIDVSVVQKHIADITKMPVLFSLLHEHAAGRAVDPHIRAVIATDAIGSRITLDCDFDFFESLPYVEVAV